MTEYRRTAWGIGRGLLFAVAFSFGASTLWAQGTAGKIQGSVQDPTGQPVANAQVLVMGTSYAALTNDDGFYFINNVPAGTYSLRAQFIGYQPAELQDVRILADQTRTINFQLAGAVALEAVTVTGAVNPIVPRDQVASKSVITNVHQLPIDDVMQAISVQPGVVVGSGGQLSIRGGRPGEAAVYIDGVPVRRIESGTAQVDVGTNTLAEASVTTGALGAEFGDAQAGVISLVTRSGGPDIQGTLAYETDEPFGDAVRLGFNRIEGSLSGPISGNLTFFVGGTVQGQQSNALGKGFNEIATYVQGPLDTTVTIVDEDGRPTDVAIPTFIQYGGQCEPDDNQGYECQGRRRPYDWESNYRLTGKLSYTYGSGSRFSVTSIWDQDQGRDFPGGQIFNPQAYSGRWSGSQYYIVNWVQQVFRTAETELAFDLNLSYQQDKLISGALDRGWELDHRDPTGGIVFSPADFLIDFDHFSDDTGERAVTQLKTEADWNQLVENNRLNQGTRVPYLNRDELRSAQPYRMNPYGLTSSFPTTGLDVFQQLEDERRLIGRLNVDWQFDRYNRFKFGGEMTRADVRTFQSGILRQNFQDVYFEKPVKWHAYAQDRLDLGDVVLDLGLRYDLFDSRALFPLTPARIFTHPAFDPDASVESMTCTTECDVNLHVFKQAESHGKLSPRLRVSFPVTDRTNFRLSYAHQAQSPEFGSMLAGKNNDISNTNTNDSFGGDVDFGKTILFEFGIRHAFAQDFVVDISAYNKDKVSDWAYRILSFFDPTQQREVNFNVLTNADFGNSRGIDLSILRRVGDIFQGNLGYTFQVAKSTGSNPFSYLNTQSRQISAVTGDRLPPAQAILPTDDDRTHNIVGSLAFTFPTDYEIGILQNTGAFVRFQFLSGLPYTRVSNSGLAQDQVTFGGTGFGLIAEREDDFLNASRLPWQKHVDLRLTRGFRVGGLDATVFGDFRNVLNFRNVVGVFAATGDVVNELDVENITQGEVDRLFQTAGSGRTVQVDKAGEQVRAVDLRDPPDGLGCSGWPGSGQEADCLLLRGAEARFGNGDGIYDVNELETAIGAWYSLIRGPQSFLGSPRHIRVGVEVNF